MKYVLSLLSFLILATVFTAASEQKRMAVSANPPNYVEIGGHQFVDLGLPSGLLWATTNLGAIHPHEDGDFYAWGETEPKSRYAWDTYKWGDADSITKYVGKSGSRLLPADDAASAKWGHGCRMPSDAEFQELWRKCIWRWKTDYHGRSGYMVIGPNGNAIFLPASGSRYGEGAETRGAYGRYWSATLNVTDSRYAKELDFGCGGICAENCDARCLGYPVRAVAERR